jgi:ParB family transcriptional regulator, chromosome partitioning protein
MKLDSIFFLTCTFLHVDGAQAIYCLMTFGDPFWCNLSVVKLMMNTSSKALSKSRRTRIASGQSEHSMRVIAVPLTSCRPNPNQPRKVFNPTALKELADSIIEHGLLQPITVKRDPKNKQGFIIVAGERRYRAFEILGRETIPAIITSGKADEIALIENLQRESLTPIEEAEALLRLKEKYNYTQDELAKSMGKARTTVTNLLKLNNLPKRIRKECSMSNIANRSFLIELARVDDPKQQLALWQEAKERGVTVRQARIKKQSKKAQQASDSQRILSSGKRFISELERLASSEVYVSNEHYEELLDIFKRFVTYMDSKADEPDQKKPNRKS